MTLTRNTLPGGVLFKFFGWWLTVLKYTLVNIQKAIENGRLWLIYPLKMVIFHIHVNVYQRVYVGLYCFGIFQCQALLLLACAKVLPPIPLLSSSVDECFMPCNSILATMQCTPWPTAWCTQELCHKLVINQLAKYWGPNLVLFSCECKSCVVKPPFCRLNVIFCQLNRNSDPWRTTWTIFQISLRKALGESDELSVLHSWIWWSFRRLLLWSQPLSESLHTAHHHRSGFVGCMLSKFYQMYLINPIV